MSMRMLPIICCIGISTLIATLAAEDRAVPTPRATHVLSNEDSSGVGNAFLTQLAANIDMQDAAARESLRWQELCHSLLAANEFLFRI